jgi:hypothetical protein
MTPLFMISCISSAIVIAFAVALIGLVILYRPDSAPQRPLTESEMNWKPKQWHNDNPALGTGKDSEMGWGP